MALAQGEEFATADVDAQVLHWDEVPEAVTNGECPTTTPDAEPILDGRHRHPPHRPRLHEQLLVLHHEARDGRVESPPVEENVEKARALVHAGAKEIRVTGQDTGVYGWDTGERKLPELLERICTEIEGDFRVRVGMANPGGVHGIREELAEVFAEHEKSTTSFTRPSSRGATTFSARCAVNTASSSTSRSSRRSTSDSTTGRSRRTSSSASPPRRTATTPSRWPSSARRAPEKVNVTRFSKPPGTDAADMKGLGGQ